MTDIFISYSRKDIAFARLIHQSLCENGLDSWIDWERIPVGEKWWSEIQQAIENANLFMFIISKHSVGSNVCKDEINIALKNNKKIIPIVIDDIAKESLDEFVPDLQKIQWIIFKHGDSFELDELHKEESGTNSQEVIAKAKRPQFDEAIKKLNVVIKTDWEWVKYHTQLQNEAHEWENNQRLTSFLLRGEALDKAEQFILAASNKEPSVTALQVEFITASKKQEKFELDEKLLMEQRSSKRLRWIIGVVVTGLIIAVFLGINWLIQSNRAQISEAKATSRQLAAQSLLFSEDEFDLPALLSIEGLKIYPTWESKSALLTLINNNTRLIKVLTNHTFKIKSIVYSTDGKLMVTGSGDGTVRFWNVIDPQNTFEISKLDYGTSIHSLAISSDGNTLAIGKDINSEFDQSIDIVDITDRKSPIIINELNDQIVSCGEKIAFSPNGNFLISSCDDDSIRIWDLSNPHIQDFLAIPPNKEDDEINSFCFSPDGTKFAIAYSNFNFQLWDFSNPYAVKLESKVHVNNIVTSLSISSDGNSLATAYVSGKTIDLWDISNIDLISQVEQIDVNEKLNESYLRPFGNVVFSPFDNTLAVIGHHKVYIYDVSNQTYRHENIELLIPQTDIISSFAFNPDGKTFTTGDSGGRIIFLDITNQNRFQVMSSTLSMNSYSNVIAIYRPDGQVLASASADDFIRLWKVTEQGKLLLIGKPIGFKTDSVSNIVFSPDGKILAADSSDFVIRLWDVSNPNDPKIFHQPLVGHTDDIQSLIFSPDGKILASASNDNTVLLWDISDPNFPQLLGNPLMGGNSEYGIADVAFSPDGKIIGVGSFDSSIFLWDVTRPESPQLLGDLIRGHTNAVLSLAFNPSGNILASASSDNSIRLWDISNPEAPKNLGYPLFGHKGYVTAIAFSPDGRTLASSGTDNTIRLWDVSDPLKIQAIDISLIGHTKSVLSVSFSPDGKTLASGSSDNTIRLWNMDVDFWKSQACAIANRNLTYSEWNRYLPEKPYQFTCPNIPISEALIRELTTLAKDALDLQDRTTAELAYAEALQKLAASDNIEYHNQICWLGSIDGFSETVSPECDKAINFASDDENKRILSDSRGLNRALNGDFKGAISDFQIFVDWTKDNDLYDSYGKLREEWIASLRDGINPFDIETLNYLRTE